MAFPTIDNIDSIQIARFVLSKLEIKYPVRNENNLLKPKPANLSAVIKDIEHLEESWELIIPHFNHSFGRKTSNEVIKLWSIPSKSAAVLENMVILLGSKKILEIGTSAGYSTLFLANGSKFSAGKVYTIEILNQKISLAKDYFNKSGLNNIYLLEGEAYGILENFNFKDVDLIFLDADKENYGRYLDLFIKDLPVGSLIIADNINDYGHLMEDYLHKVTGTHLPASRTDNRLKSYYLGALDNGLLFTKKIQD